jgi:quinolinate synthase
LDRVGGDKGVTGQADLTSRIQELKKSRGAVILAHNYQLPEVQDVADFSGDSLELSRKAAATDAEVIVFCGVHFMAETAKILSPGKTVLIPDVHAGCPMADMITLSQLREFKAQYPGRPVVAYVNTSAEVKAESDICCTSANAVKVVEALDAPEVLFLPDKCLGAYVASNTSKNVILYPGYCPTHHRILPQHVLEQKTLHPGALVIAHPECTPEVLALADAVASTSGIVRYVQESNREEFIVCTEQGLLHRLQQDNPSKRFYNPGSLNVCPNMKKITLEKVAWSLQDLVYRVEVPDEIMKKARAAIDGMVAIG